jgi:fructose-bisphosphate aldolase class II
MPVPTPKEFHQILSTAKEKHYALPAINVTSLESANAAISGFLSERSDGIVQLSLGAGKHASGPAEDNVLGAVSIAEHVHRVALKLPIYVALHTDHCQFEHISFIKSLIAISKERVEKGFQPLFNGHMFDGSALPLAKNLEIAKEILNECGSIGLIPEFEAGVVGGEEEGAHSATTHDELYTTPEDMVQVAQTLGNEFPYMFAATFGNVHGIYKPGNVKLKPEILKNGQKAIAAKLGDKRELFLVFHGGSGTPVADVRETLNYGVIKMNVDTAAQYAFTREIAHHMFSNYAGVLMVDGELGDKKAYDPRSYLKKGISGMAKRVAIACQDLRSSGESLCQ